MAENHPILLPKTIILQPSDQLLKTQDAIVTTRMTLHFLVGNPNKVFIWVEATRWAPTTYKWTYNLSEWQKIHGVTAENKRVSKWGQKTTIQVEL